MKGVIFSKLLINFVLSNFFFLHLFEKIKFTSQMTSKKMVIKISHTPFSANGLGQGQVIVYEDRNKNLDYDEKYNSKRVSFFYVLVL